MRSLAAAPPPRVAAVPAAERRAQTAAQRWGPVVLAAVVLAGGLGAVGGFVLTLEVLTVLGFGLAAVGLRWPPLGLLGIAVLCTIDAPSRIFLMSDNGVLPYNSLNYWLMLVTVLAVPRLWSVRDLPVRLLMFFVLYLALQLVVSAELELGVQHVANVACTFGLLAYTLAGGRDRETWTWVGLTGSAAGAGAGWAYYAHAATLPYANPNAWSYCPITALICGCFGYLAARERPRLQVVIALLSAIDVVWVFLSGSRGGMLIAALGVLFLFWATRGVSRRATMVGTTLLIAAAVSTQFADLQAGALGRVGKLVDAQRSLSNRTSGRSDLALGGWYIFSRHPFGVGTGGFASAWAELGPQEGLGAFARGERFSAHAGWIKTLVEGGVPGVALLLAFALSFGIVGFRCGTRPARLVGIFTAAVLCFAWISTEFQAKGLWFLAAASTAVLRLEVPARLRGANREAGHV